MAGRLNARAAIGLAMLLLASLACNMQIGDTLPTTVAVTAAVSFVAPDNNSTIGQGSTIELAVKLQGDNLDGAKVDFLVDSNSIGSQTVALQTDGTDATEAVQNAVTVTFRWTPTEARGYLVSAQATRPDGSTIGAADLTLQVVAMPTTVGQTTPSLVPTPAPLPSFTPTLNQPPAATVGATLLPSLPPIATTIPPTTASPPTVAPVPAGNRPTIRVTFSYLNIRAGPGVNFPVIGKLVLDDTATIVGRNADFTWFVIEHSGTQGWIYNTPAYITINGDTSGVPLAASPPTPIPGPAQPTATVKLAPTSTVGAVADLVIDSATLNPPSPTANQTFTVTVVIRNQGTVDASSSLLAGVFQPLDEHSDTAVPPIPAGQKVTVTLPVTLKASGSNQTGTLTLDANHDINEGPVGEANNVLTLTYNVN